MNTTTTRPATYGELVAAARAICAAEPGYGSPAYRGDPYEAVALQQQAERMVDDMARRLVADDVRYCVSSLVSTLMADAFNEDAIMGEDDAMTLSARLPDPDDFREALAYSASKGRLNVTKGDGVWYYATTDEDGDAADEGQGYSDCERSAWQAGFDSLGMDHPAGADCLEHWLVGDRLADDLEAQGEAIARDVAGLTIWGRCGSGQAIYADAVIQRIARDVLEA